MSDYKKMYLILFRAITKAISILQKAQIECEEIYMDSTDDKIISMPEKKPIKKE